MAAHNSKPGISVVIPNYNGEQLLAQNLPSVYEALNTSGCPYEIIIPDDASADNSITFLQKNYQQVIIIQSEKNDGFSVNINKGIKAAKLELVLLLNSDIKLSPDYFAQQLKYFEKPDTFGVMGQIRDETTDKVVESCKYPLPSVFKINYFKNIVVNSTNAVYTYYLSGANALVNREKLDMLGGFNEIFSPFYHEDLDLSLRAWESGWTCYYENSAVCWHSVSATIKAHSSKNTIKAISTRNRMLLHYFHLEGLRLWLWFTVSVLSLTIRWISGKFYHYRAFKLFIQKLPQMHIYKQQFNNNINLKHIPFITIKHTIKTAIDNDLNPPN